MDLISPALLVISLLVFAQALFTLYLMLYTWEHPDRLRASSGPARLRGAKIGFSVLLPARHEELVIGDTIRRVLKANYPARLVEVIVICSSDDTGTIEVAQRTIKKLRTTRARVITFAGEPINKPHALNVGFAASRKEVVTIFDAEDDIDPEIFRIINTVMLDEGVGIVQAGVQLVNHADHWFSLLNCLEYFFWFKSRLHFHARVGMIPLGGNTVFIARNLISRVGAWDPQCLTEDADIGIRLSALGERIRVVYDAKHVTREETPASLAELIRQRTRWHQGFIQVLRKGDWLQISGFGRKLLALYTLTFPIIQVPLTLLWPVAVIGGLWLRLPILVAMASFLPLYVVGFQVLVNMVGATMFAREFGFQMRPWTPLSLALTFVPYQFALGLASARAVVRELQGTGTWEKTDHVGAHRRERPARARRTWPVVPVTVRLPRSLPLPLTQLLRSMRTAAGRKLPSVRATAGQIVTSVQRSRHAPSVRIATVRNAIPSELPVIGTWERTKHLAVYRPRLAGVLRRLPMQVVPKVARPLPLSPSPGGVRTAGHTLTILLTKPLQMLAWVRRPGDDARIGLLKVWRRSLENMDLSIATGRSFDSSPVAPAQAASSPSLASLIRATIDVPQPDAQLALQEASPTCNHALVAGGARFCRRCGAMLQVRDSSTAIGADMGTSHVPRRRMLLSGHIARALVGVVLALILSVGLPFVATAPSTGRDGPGSVADR